MEVGLRGPNGKGGKFPRMILKMSIGGLWARMLKK